MGRGRRREGAARLTALFVLSVGAGSALAYGLRAAQRGRRGRAAATLDRLAASRLPAALWPESRRGAGPARLPFPFSYLNRRLAEGAVRASLQTVGLVALGGGLGCWAAASLLLGAGWPADLAVAGGLWAPLAWVQYLARRRREAIAAEMERAVAGLEAAVSAGMVPYEALLDVGLDTGGILGPELLRTVADADRIGLSEALVLLRARLPLPEVTLLVAGLRLNQGAGAELAGGLGELHRTLLERRETAAAMRAATAGGRWQAGMLVAVPPVLLLFMRLLYPAFEAPLFQSALGRLLLAGCSAWVLIGYAVVLRISVPREVL